MNICYINPTNNIRRPIAELAKILAKKGHKITIMFPVSSDCPTKNWVANEAVKNPNIKAIPIPSWYFAPLRYSFPNLLKLWKASRHILKKNDIVHIWEYYYPISVLPILKSWFTKKLRKKVILTTDGFVGYSYKPNEPRWLVPAFKVYTTLFARILFRIVPKMTTYGKPLLPFAYQAGVPKKKIEVQITGIHLDRFKSVDDTKVDALKKEFNIKDEKVVLYVGMLTERKGIKKVIKVGKDLVDQGVKVKTLIVGDAHGDNPYPKLVNEKYKDNIIFTGGRKEIPEFMKLADVLLLPSEGEGRAGVIMEAMASGTCVVATNESCTPDLIEHGKEGFLVKLNEDYTTPTKKLLLDNNLREGFGAKAKEKAKTFSWDKVTKDYEEMYKSIVT